MEKHHQQPNPSPYPMTWTTRVQGRREMAAACSAAKREGATLLVRLSKATCAPCHRSEILLRALLDAVAQVPSRGGELRVYWLDADDPGSSDVFNFFASRRQCRGVPALFLFRGSEDLHAPNLAQDGAEPFGLVRIVARAAALGGPRDLGEPGAMHAKVEPDLAYLRAYCAPHDAAVHAVLHAAAPFLQIAPPPRTSSVPANATEMVQQAAQQQQQQRMTFTQQQQQQQHYQG